MVVWLSLIQLLLLASFFPTAQAWGKDGHEIVGNVAWMLLSGPVQDQISKILVNRTTHHGTDGDEDKDVDTVNGMIRSNDCAELCSPLASVADWADQVRIHYHWSAPLHYIDVRDDEIPTGCPAATAASNHTNLFCYFNYTRDCPNDFCVAGAIVNYTKQLLQEGTSKARVTATDEQREEALMFLVHFVGDIHQPLHCARQTDRGGNSIHVRYESMPRSKQSISTTRTRTSNPDMHKRTLETEENESISRVRLRQSLQKNELEHHALNLHAVWDDKIIETALAKTHNHSRNAMEAHLLSFLWQTRHTSPSTWKKWLQCADGSQTQCTSQWGEESWAFAASHAYRNTDGTDIEDGDLLQDEYYSSRLPVVQERLAVAALRLATTLEQVFSFANELDAVSQSRLPTMSRTVWSFGTVE